MKYQKIQTLWKRQGTEGKHKGHIVPDEFSKEEFDNIRYWHVTEKIDGTNIRIQLEEWDFDAMHKTKTLTIKGRTDAANIPKKLKEFLEAKFTEKGMIEQFPDVKNIILFGEGFGGYIQKAGKFYSDDCSFILFDVWIDGWWLDYGSVVEIADKLGIQCVPSLGLLSKDEIEEYVKSEPKSVVSKQEQIMEGVVCTSAPMLLFRDGKPLRFKLKVNDYKKIGELNRQKAVSSLQEQEDNQTPKKTVQE